MPDGISEENVEVEIIEEAKVPMDGKNATGIFEQEPAESITKISPAPENLDDAKPTNKEEPK